MTSALAGRYDLILMDGNLPGRDCAPGAGDILDHDLLAELGAHGLRDQPGDGVGRSTG